ncbi:transcriptional regulator, HxlR family [Actinobacteria bacterium OK074]|nr:transcriptional regulator, HxlR family [Actinobacteria bacterium OK074]
MAVAAPTPAAPGPSIESVRATVDVLAPRWNVWVLQALQHSGAPVRFGALQQTLPVIPTSSLSRRLQHLTKNALVTVEAKGSRRAIYALADRAARLTPVYEALAHWSRTHLEDIGPTAYAQQSEDALALVSGKHAVEVLWALREHGEMRSGELWKRICPQMSDMAMSVRLRQLREDGLIMRTADSMLAPYRLTEAGHAFDPVYKAMSAWTAVSAPTTTPPPPPATGVRRRSGSVAAAAVATGPRVSGPVTAQRPEPTWRRAELFSHTTPSPAAGAAGPVHGGRGR